MKFPSRARTKKPETVVDPTPVATPVVEAAPIPTVDVASDLARVEDARSTLARAFDTYAKSAEGPVKRLRVYAASSDESVRREASDLLALYEPTLLGERR